MMTLVDAFRRACGYRFPPLGPAAFATIFRMLPTRGNVELVPGIRAELDFGDATMRATYWQGDRFERPTAQVLQRWAEGATHFFDMGSNYGFFSYYLLSRRPGLEVHAFEPNRITFARMEATRVANQLATFHAWNIGLGDAAGSLNLHPGLDDSGHSTFGPHPSFVNNSLGEVEVDRFDSWRAKQGLALPDRPTWIAKIDVEGFEARVLQGMSESLKARAFAGIVIEVNPYTLGFCDSSPREVRDLLQSHGYREQAPLSEVGNSFYIPA